MTRERLTVLINPPQVIGTRLLRQFTPLLNGLDDVKITVRSSRMPRSY